MLKAILEFWKWHKVLKIMGVNLFEDAVCFGIKIVILLSLVMLAAYHSKAQDTTFITNGYEVDYPHVYLRVDTVKRIVQARTFYRHEHIVNVKYSKQYFWSKGIKVYFKSAFTFPYRPGAILIISRRKFKHEIVL